MKQHDEKEMYVYYEQWQSSGQSKAIFAKQQGIRLSVFYYWMKKFEQKKTGKGSPIQGFEVLSLDPPLTHNQALVLINFPSGIIVELYNSVEVGFIKALIG